MKTLVLLLFALWAPIQVHAVAAPTGLTVTAIQADQSATLSWTNDSTVQQWYIFLDGTLVYQPFVANTTLNGSQRQFVMQALPYRPSITINMKALAPPNPISSYSAAVTTTANPNSNPVIPMGSDGSTPAYTTQGAAALPTTPPLLSQVGPGYEFGACTTCTAGARFFGLVRFNASYITAVTAEVTKTTAVQGISMCFLTPAARTRTTIFNPSASGKVLRFLEWYQATPPNFPVEELRELTPGASVTIEDSLPYLNIISPAGTPAVPASVLHVTDTKWAGNNYP